MGRPVMVVIVRVLTIKMHATKLSLLVERKYVELRLIAR